MQIYLTGELDRWLERTETKATAGDEVAQLRLDYVNAELDLLDELTEPPTPATETAQLKRVRQSRQFELWRVSHAFHSGMAVRLICWFPPDRETVVVALFAGDKGGRWAMFGTTASLRARTPRSTVGAGNTRITSTSKSTPRMKETTMARTTSNTARPSTSTSTAETTFVDGSERLARLRADPERAKRVKKIREAGREMDRVYALNLASIRRAADMTQDVIAERVGVGQGDVSKLEHRQDLLLSTLLNYLSATGAEDPRIVITVNGQEIEFDLGSLEHTDDRGSVVS